MSLPELSVVVIGRNEAEHLPRLYEGLAVLMTRLHCETLYVDSASADSSVEVARRLFDRVIELAPDHRLNASAGRSVGVAMATGRWMLFLDGDMELQADCIPELVRHVKQSPLNIGAVGPYVHHFEGALSRTWLPPKGRDGFVTHFGGAVMLSASVLQSENWDPRLYSNEEVELYTRLRSRGVKVIGFEGNFISHFTDTYSFKEKLCGIFIRQGSFLGKKFHGIGQVLRARVRSKQLLSLMRWWPEPFVFWGLLLGGLVLGSIGQWIWAMISCAFAIGLISWRKGSRSVVAYLGFLPQALSGFSAFSPEFSPTVIAVHERTCASRK